jgi:hypothetical protein
MFLIWPVEHDANIRFELHGLLGSKPPKTTMISSDGFLAVIQWKEELSPAEVARIKRHKEFGEIIDAVEELPPWWE